MNQQLLDRIRKGPQLPSLPAVAVNVLDLAKRPNASLSEVTKVISGDPALAARVLRTVNSSFYALPNQVKTIHHAVAMLGLQTVKTLALGFSLAGSMNANRSASFDYVRFWRQSLCSAAAARSVAKTVRTGEHEEAFLAGLLSDIGTLAMHRVLGSDYDVLLDACEGDQIELIRLSTEKFDLDHTQVGGMLAEHWKFPAALVEPIRQHHRLHDAAAPATGERPSLTCVVHAGVMCGQVFASTRPGLLEKARQELNQRFQLDAESIQRIFGEIDQQASELGSLLEVSIQPGRSLLEIEEDARQTLVDLTVQTQVHVQEVERLNYDLQRQATTDAVTGLSNRKQFDGFLVSSLSEARSAGQPLSLLFLDLDRFKSINDTHGHQAGDLVLARLGQLLKSLIGTSDLAARYGGDELAVVLRQVDSAAAQRVAERIRNAIPAVTVVFGETTIPVTASIGVATSDAQTNYSTSEELIAAADRAVYAAKGAGRNCVRSSPRAAKRGAA